MTDDKLTEPLEVLQSLDAIEDGATADSLESQTLDFKEDPAVHPQNGNPDASLVEFLADETVCFSMATEGFRTLCWGFPIGPRASRIYGNKSGPRLDCPEDLQQHPAAHSGGNNTS